jgi:hypothetical protein
VDEREAEALGAAEEGRRQHAAQDVSAVVTPDRFRKRPQFWSYGGLDLVMRSSSDRVKDGKGQSARATTDKTLGLDFNHNHTLKQVCKRAATMIATQRSEHCVRADDPRMLDGGTKRHLARVTLARKVASNALATWKYQRSTTRSLTASHRHDLGR